MAVALDRPLDDPAVAAEIAADRAVWERLGVPREVLYRALQKLHTLRAVRQLKLQPTPAARRAVPEVLGERDESAVRNLEKLPVARRVPVVWWLFREQYFHAMELHYWHPGDRERLAAIRGSEKDSPEGDGSNAETSP